MSTSNNKIISTEDNSNKNNDLKIVLYPNKKPRDELEKESINKIITKEDLGHSFDINQNLAFLGKNVPVLNGFYIAHINHYPIRIKPDDIWLLIVQAFSNHVNANSESLRTYFVNFDGKKELEVDYTLTYIHEVKKEHLEDFSKQLNKQMKEYLGEEIL